MNSAICSAGSTGSRICRSGGTSGTRPSPGSATEALSRLDGGPAGDQVLRVGQAPLGERQDRLGAGVPAGEDGGPLVPGPLGEPGGQPRAQLGPVPRVAPVGQVS